MSALIFLALLCVPGSAHAASPSPFGNVSPIQIGAFTSLKRFFHISVSPFAMLSAAAQPQPLALLPKPILVAPSLTVLVQPAEVFAGESVLVSWTSVGMQKDSPCRMGADGITLGSGNSGSIRVPVGNATGTRTFTLSCLSALSGSSTQKAASVTVR